VAVDHEPIFFNLADDPTNAHDVVVQVSAHTAEGDGIPGRGCAREQVVRPCSRRIRAEHDCGIEDPAELFNQARADFGPQVVVGIIQNRFGNRHDDSDLLGVEVFVVPIDFGRLLETRVA